VRDAYAIGKLIGDFAAPRRARQLRRGHPRATASTMPISSPTSWTSTSPARCDAARRRASA
jgi:hypothetical protein